MASYPALVLILVSSAFLRCEAGKILVYPVDGSHWLTMKILVETLHSRGHQITVFRSNTSWYVSETSPHYTAITIPQNEGQVMESQEAMTTFLKRSIDIRRSNSIWSTLELYNNVFDLIHENQKVVAKFALSILGNKTLVEELKAGGYDLFLTDPVFPGGVIVAHYLQLPLVLNVRWIFNGDAHFAFAPSPLSYVPQLFSKLSDKMDLFQRIKNLFHHAALVYMHHYVSAPPFQAVCDKYLTGGVDIMSLVQNTDLWLMKMDFTFDFPRPTMPNVVYIGGYQGKPPKPLPSDLEDFVQSSGEHGVVIMTMGTLLNDLGPQVSEIIAKVFASLPQKFVWRHKGQRPASLGNNTMLVDWMPQNDLLGHPKIKLFITHGGTNGIYEAIYHGVPILGIPLIFDQYDNLVRLQARGVGEIVEITTMNAESLTNDLKNILDPANKYKENMVKLSELHHDKPMKPLDTAMFWMEFVMRHKGAAHLRTESYKMPWYSYHNVDAIAVVLAFTTAVLFLVLVFCRRLVKFLFSKKNSSKSKSE